METSRDIFLFAYYTGAAYCDLMELSKSHLVRDDEGKMWLKFNRHKTGVLCRIKLLPESISLMERFHDDESEKHNGVTWDYSSRVWSGIDGRLYGTFTNSSELNQTIKLDINFKLY
jgi:hypothetical protein